MLLSTALDRAGESLRRRGIDLVTAARRVRAARDDEAIHDLRVALRRLETALALWRPLLEPRARRQLRRRSRGLRRRLGRTREREVLVTLLHAEKATAEREVAAAAALRKRWLRRVERGRRKARRAASKRRVGRMLSLLDAARSDSALRAAERPDWLAFANRRADRNRDRAQAALRAARSAPEDAALHQARIALKRWRYGEEGLSGGLRRGPASDSVRLRELQDVLGRLHDLIVFRDRLLRESSRRAARGDEPDAVALGALAARVEARRLAELARLTGPAPADLSFAG
ncbi:MAG TPA: CHAD domain-containing protein [Terriglobales bacterium]|nr:CHAD domain-containing protein [Terriglobales bacterium]